MGSPTSPVGSPSASGGRAESPSAHVGSPTLGGGGKAHTKRKAEDGTSGVMKKRKSEAGAAASPTAAHAGAAPSSTSASAFAGTFRAVGDSHLPRRSHGGYTGVSSHFVET